MKKIKKMFPYLGLFLLFFFWNLLIQPLNLDEVWNYGFAYGIFSGQLPYVDFNMVITPFYPMLQALFFVLFDFNMIVFHAVNAMVLTVTCYLLFSLWKENTWFLLLLFFFPVSFTYPSYNNFLFFLYVLLVYLEKGNKSDWWIGFILGIVLLTKQSVGAFLLFPSLYYFFKEKKKLWKRCLGALFPLSIFLVFLVLTNSFSSFWDLCFLGLLDFAEGNGKIQWTFFLFLGLVLLTCYYTLRHPKNILCYYTLAFYSIVLPIFDSYHLQIAMVSFFLLLLENFDIKTILRPKLLFFPAFLGICLVTMGYRFSDGVIYPNDIPNFQYRLLDKKSIAFTMEVCNFMQEYSSKEFIFLNANAYYFRIIEQQEISYLDLINQGNWGYHGSDKLFEEVKKKKDAIFVVDPSELSSKKQTDKRILHYVIEKGRKIKTIDIYDFYVLDS